MNFLTFLRRKILIWNSRNTTRLSLPTKSIKKDNGGVLIERAHYYPILVKEVCTIRLGVLIEEGALTEVVRYAMRKGFKNLHVSADWGFAWFCAMYLPILPAVSWNYKLFLTASNEEEWCLKLLCCCCYCCNCCLILCKIYGCFSLKLKFFIFISFKKLTSWSKTF